MIANVTYPYRDRETLEVRLPGEQVELAERRFAELAAGGFVEPAPGREPAPEPDAADEPRAAEGGAGQEGEPDAAGAAAEPEEAAPEPTVADLRAEIEAAGGFAPKKATKAQLAEILGSL